MMKIKNMIACVMALALALALALTLGCAAAEEMPGNLPSRGMSIPMTQADVEAGIAWSAYIDVDDGAGMPCIYAAVLSYASPAYDEIFLEASKVFETGDFAATEELLRKAYDYYYNIARIYLAASEEDIAMVKAYDPEAEMLCENDGYTYMMAVYDYTPSEGDDAALFEAAEARIRELVQQITFQPVELSEEDLAGRPETVIPNTFPMFTAELLTGGTVDHSVFKQKDLTVVNIWATTCFPCISEMPELEAWSKEMPENVQLVGLLCDVTADSDEDVELAQTICEMTGVTYPIWLYSEDFREMLSGVVFTPTTIFVDRNGSIVGEPVCGAEVDLYKEFVSEYLGAL